MRYTPILSLLFPVLISCNPDERGKTMEEEGVRQINGTSIFCHSIGEGEPILVIHGGPGLGYHYLYKHLEPLSKNHKLIFYDQRGCGRSLPGTDPNSVDMDTFLNDIKEIRKSYNINKINILAHSWGGLLAMGYAINYSENVKSLILVSSSSGDSYKPKETANEWRSRISPSDRKRMLELQDIYMSPLSEDVRFNAVNELMYLSLKYQFKDTAQAKELDLGLDKNYLATSQLLNNLYKNLSEYNLYQRLEHLNIPSLIIYGDYDPLMKLAGEKLHKSIKGSQYVIIKDCGHFPFIEKKEEFFTTVNSFFNDTVIQ